MERNDNSDKMAICKDLCSSLLMLFLGLFFGFLLTMVTYFTYQTVVGNRQFCTLWIDVPGRFMILLICGYIASVCGFLPLPQRYRINSFIVPFNVWRLRSWKRLLRNMFFSIPFRSLIMRLQRNVATVQENVETPLLQENSFEYLYIPPPRRRRKTTPIDIPYPESYITPVFVTSPEITPRNEITPGLTKHSNGSVTSIDPSGGDIVLPTMPGKSCKRHYMSEDSIKDSESADDAGKEPSMYRKKISDIKWTGEVAIPPPDYHAATRGRQAILASNAQPTVFTGDGKLAKSRRGSENEVPELHIKKHLPPIPDEKTVDPPVTSQQPLVDKYFEVTDEEKFLITREPELDRSEIEVQTTSDKVLSKTERVPKSGNLKNVHNINLNPEREVQEATTSNVSETHLKFLGTRDINQLSRLESAKKEREKKTRPRNEETSLNFPRFPWINLRNPKGVSARANKLHKKNLEFEKREIQRYAEMRHRRQVHLDRMVRSLLGNVRSQRAFRTGQSSENINVTSRIENVPLGSTKGTYNRIGVRQVTSSGKVNVGQTTNRYGVRQEQEIENTKTSQNRGSLVFSLRSDRQGYRTKSSDRATDRSHQLPSQKFQIKTRTRSQIEDKISFKLEKLAADEQKDSEGMTHEAGSSNLSKFVDGATRASIEGPKEETAIENFNRLQLHDLREKLVHMKHGKKYLDVGDSATIESKQNICTKTTDKNDKETVESVVSAELDEAAGKPDIKILIDSLLNRSESDRDSDLDQTEK